MILKVVAGKNYKNFVQILDLKTKEDFELYEVITKILTRREYKPFIKKFDKFISYNYFITDFIFPATFLPDVKKQLLQLSDKVEILNEEILYYDELDKEVAYEYISKLNVPDEIKVDDENYAFQRKSAVEGIYNKRSCIEVATSGGKTFITYLYCKLLFEFVIKNRSKKILVVVPSKMLAGQLRDDFAEFDKMNSFADKLVVESIFAGAKQVFDADIVCGTYQSLSNYEKEYFDDFHAIIIDELHTAKAYSIRNEIESKCLNCEFAFGMTGTMPEYKTLDYLHITSMFGKSVVKFTSEEAIKSGISTPILIEIIKIDYNDDLKDFSKNLVEQGIVGIEKLVEEKKFFQNYEPRNRIIGKLLKHYTSNSLILVSTVEYCETLKKYLESYLGDSWNFSIIHGTIDNREDIIYDFKNSPSNNCIIATYGTMSTGVSIKNIGAIYFPDGGKSEKRIRQSLGRGMRLFPTKDYCLCFDLQDNMISSAFKNQAYERTKIYKEQKFPFKITKVTI